MMNIRAIAGLIFMALAAACSQSSSPPAPPPTGTPPPPPPPPPAGMVTISGAVTFDLVPLNPATNGLDYSAITQSPARGIIVEALDAGGSVLDTTVTNGSGQYSVTVNSNTNVRIRARARMTESNIASWTVTVRDNTNSDADYVLDGSLTSSGAANSTRNLNAASGWGGSSYTGTRAAAPFALLDVIYNALMLINGTAPGTTFPELQVYWSINNRAASGDIANGEIGTTSFRSGGGLLPTILVLGNENSDTDEYDRHVIAHEYGHYVESQLSRLDSIGGSHALGQRLDPRLAMSEGFSNAFSAMVESDPVYRDSGGAGQAIGFSFNVESTTAAPNGWYNEASVQLVIYDIFDSNSDGVDAISAGFGPIYSALTDPNYINASQPTTLFAFIDSLRTNSSISDADINALLADQSIIGTGPIGAGETNDGGIPSVLPIAKTVSVGGGATTVCSFDDAGTTNRLGNFDFLLLSISTTGSYTLTMTTSSGPANRDPDFVVFQGNNFIANANSTTADSETLTRNLQAGDYWISASDFQNIDDGGSAGDACFNFTVN